MREGLGYNDSMERIVKRSSLKWATVMVVLVLAMTNVIWGLEIKKEFEITFETAPQYFVIEGNIHLWQNGKLTVYNENKPEKEMDLLKKGEGPGDFRVIQNLTQYEDKYYFWDRMLIRMTTFSKDWKRLEIQKFMVSQMSGHLGKTSKGHIFKWSRADREKKGRFLIEKIGFVNGKERKVLAESRGLFAKEKALNHHRSHLIYTLNGNTLYYAINNEYKVYAIDVENQNPKPRLIAKRDLEPQKWQESLQELQYEVIRRPARAGKEIFPEYVPPLFQIAAHGDWLAVVTNKQILNSKTRVDIFKEGKYMGSLTLPLLYQQYFVFPSFLNFPPDFYISGNALFTLHYNSENDEYKISKWRFSF